MPQVLANKIAAGEVVERPASVVKELVENALDAGASRIVVHVHAGGRDLIRVTDDGWGMCRDDALLSIQRHSTSKVKDAVDLERIGTYGFRGEALPSIASVSRLEMVTRERDADSGVSVIVEGGEVRSVSEVGASSGTTITIRSLFFNTPARAKFLKSQATEMRHIVSFLSAQAIARPDVLFQVHSGQRELFTASPTSDLPSRIAHVFGEEIASALVPVSGEAGDFVLSGLVGLPTAGRRTRDMQLLFVNDRCVHDRAVMQALAQAYRGLVAPGTFPPAFIFLQVNPRYVDVNVHPGKREVKFADSSALFSLVSNAVRGAVSGAALGDKSGWSPQRVEQAVSGYMASKGGERPVSSEGAHGRAGRSAGGGAQQTRFASAPPPADSGPSVAQSVPAPTPLEPGASLSGLTYIGSVGSTYLLCADESGLVIIDQHALHERVLYQRLIESTPARRPEVQPLLIPLTVSLSRRDATLAAEYAPVFAEMGLEVEGFGDSDVVVRAMPAVFGPVDAQRFIVDVIGELSERGRSARAQEMREAAAAVMACHAAVKAGDPLGDEEARALIRAASAIPGWMTCPHGRPTALRVGAAELARRFHRS